MCDAGITFSRLLLHSPLVCRVDRLIGHHQIDDYKYFSGCNTVDSRRQIRNTAFHFAAYTVKYLQ